ncbi:MAG TPA: peptidylprolyl isomerase [Bacteroidales bacterium]|nr:peptidylprolyl isomerase [Bacteroidales bacterium]HPK30209.1 peptidylprolyl isomerase [Bacteroidales bacterium]
MKHTLVATALFLIISLFGMDISAQRYQGGLIDKTIVLIGNDMIMLSDLENEVQMMSARGFTADRSARCQILEEMLVSKLFLNQARIDSLDVNEATVESSLTQRINEVMTQLGGEKQMEEYFNKPLYKLRQEWKEMLTEQSLIQDMQRKVAGNIPNLTPSDIEKYCKETPEEDLPIVSTQYRIRQIVLYPDKEAAELEVKERLLGLRERIVAGEKFSTLARIYSQDPGSYTKGGELGMASKTIFWPAFSDAAMSLKVGQVSQIVETPDGYHLIELIAREGDMFNARHILIKPHYTTEDRVKAFDRLDTIRTRILGDSISFFNAARYFSEDRKTATNGGLLADEYSGSSYFEKDQLKPADYNVLKDMQEGDISEPFESLDNEGRSGNTVYKIIMLEKIIPSHVADYKTDFNVLLDDANRKNSTAAIDKFISEKQKSTYIVIDPLFRECNFMREGWVK